MINKLKTIECNYNSCDFKSKYKSHINRHINIRKNIVMFENFLTFDPIKYKFNRCRDL
jgi:hypothetical protein